MVHLLQCSSSSSRLHILFLFLFYSFLLLTSSMEAACFLDARRSSSSPLRLQPEDTGGGTNKLAVATENNNKQEQAAAARSIRGETTTEGRWRRALIGSRPPRCERVCMSCGHCEAVQVPVVPQEEMEIKAKAARSRASSAAVTGLTAAMFTYRVDGIANYKPLSWKCRCGGTILDP